MFAKKKVDRLEVPADHAFRDKLEQAATGEKPKDAMHKDAHLIEAARAQGMRVASLDHAVREHFRKVAASVRLLRKVCWINPNIPAEEPIQCLEAGTPADEIRMLR